MDCISNEIIQEECVKEIHADDVILDENRGINHVHTFNVSQRYEAIDFNYNKFYPNKVFIRFWQRVIHKKRTHK